MCFTQSRISCTRYAISCLPPRMQCVPDHANLISRWWPPRPGQLASVLLFFLSAFTSFPGFWSVYDRVSRFSRQRSRNLSCQFCSCACPSSQSSPRLQPNSDDCAIPVCDSIACDCEGPATCRVEGFHIAEAEILGSEQQEVRSGVFLAIVRPQFPPENKHKNW